MDFVIDFVYVGDGDAIIVWARDPGKADWVFFIDGGNSGNGQKVVDHYNNYIKPYLQDSREVGFINSHPHEDHIDGILEIIEKLDGQISFAIYNDPVECITAEHKDRIHKAYVEGEDPDLTHLYKTFEQVEKLNDYCSKRNIKRYHAYSEDIDFFNGAFKLLSPSKDFYVNMVQYFSDVDFLKVEDFSKKTVSDIDEDEDLKPCDIVDESNDASPENLTSTVIQLTDSQNRKHILTGDAGVDSFDYMESEGFSPSDIGFVQLPHHGSRRNVNTRWLTKFNPSLYIVSAEGNVHHPRRAVINCIKRNLKNCKVYSTHTNKEGLCYTTNRQVFPNRGWNAAISL